MSNAIAFLITAPIIIPMHYFERRKLKRNIRAWIGPAIKKGRNSVEWEFVEKWSYRLNTL